MCGHLAAARQLCTVMSSSRISLLKTKSILGKMVDINKPLPDVEEEEEEEDLSAATPRATRSLRQQAHERWTQRNEESEQLKVMIQVLRAQAKVFLGLEQLVEALVSLEDWKAIVDDMSQYVTFPPSLHV